MKSLQGVNGRISTCDSLMSEEKRLIYQGVKMMDQNLARAVQNWDFELIGHLIQSFPITGIKPRESFCQFAPCAPGKFWAYARYN
jgi:hypothetical protein